MSLIDPRQQERTKNIPKRRNERGNKKGQKELVKNTKITSRTQLNQESQRAYGGYGHRFLQNQVTI
jgi:hypothetical protein